MNDKKVVVVYYYYDSNRGLIREEGEWPECLPPKKEILKGGQVKGSIKLGKIPGWDGPFAKNELSLCSCGTHVLHSGSQSPEEEIVETLVRVLMVEKISEINKEVIKKLFPKPKSKPK